jgi:hypothetical protein
MRMGVFDAPDADGRAAGRGSQTPPLKGPEDPAVGVSPGLETSGLPEGGVVRPAPNKGPTPHRRKARNPKHEIQMTKTFWILRIRISDLFRISDFVLRAFLL